MEYQLIRFESISNPPRDSAVAMERTFESVEFSGSSDHSSMLTAERLEALRSLPIVRFAFGFLRVWRGLVIAFIAFSTLLLLVAVGNIKALGGPQDAVVVLGFLIFFILVGQAMLRRGRVQPSLQDAAAGRGLMQKWQLKITRTDVEATEEFMGQAADPRRCRPEDIRQISVSTDGSLIAQLADRSGETESQMVLTGPLDQEDADWLENALSQLLGVKDKGRG